jgi:nucleoid-associated protein YgaU
MSTITITPSVPGVPTAYDARDRRGGVRLTPRGRLAVLLLGLALTLGVGLWLAAGSVATDDGGVVQVEVVTVAPGDTLWDIASEAAAGGDVPGMMQRIEELNTLDSKMLYAGQELRIPLDD